MMCGFCLFFDQNPANHVKENTKTLCIAKGKEHKPYEFGNKSSFAYTRHGGIITDVVMPKTLKKESYYLKKKREERCRSRAGIEGLISNLKHDQRMLRNYLKGTAGDKINTLLAASAYNMMKWMRLKRQEILIFSFSVVLPSDLFFAGKYPKLLNE